MLNLSFLRKDRLSPNYGQGEISEVIRQGYEWRVKAKGSYWTGISAIPMTAKVGDRVRVMGTQGIRLLIEAHDPKF